jgi:hypothetical protein
MPDLRRDVSELVASPGSFVFRGGTMHIHTAGPMYDNFRDASRNLGLCDRCSYASCAWVSWSPRARQERPTPVYGVMIANAPNSLGAGSAMPDPSMIPMAVVRHCYLPRSCCREGHKWVHLVRTPVRPALTSHPSSAHRGETVRYAGSRHETLVVHLLGSAGDCRLNPAILCGAADRLRSAVTSGFLAPIPSRGLQLLCDELRR